MNTFLFKTNINCQGCIDKVSPFLKKAGEHVKWEVDTKHRNKLLTVKAVDEDVKKVVELVKEAGFNILPYEEI